MRPPSIPVLQLLNTLVAFASYLALKQGIAAWTAAGWSAPSIGLTVTVMSMAYGIPVSWGGMLADGYGRARVSSIGAVIGTLGCGLPLLYPSPLTDAVAVIIAFFGCAFFFPGIAGLFSDSGSIRAETQAAPRPLHYRVSQYNLGWSFGNVLGLTSAIFIGDLPMWVGYTLSTVTFALPVVLLWPFRHLPPRPPGSTGDRSDHPALRMLTLMGRIGCLFACLVGYSLFSQLDKALSEHLPPLEASHRASIALTGYCSGYFLMFVWLGRWSGWVLHPWRLFLMQAGLIVGPIGLMLLGLSHLTTVIPLVACTVLTGLGYGAAYTGSIYYSMRLPQGASRAAGLHETFLGMGNTAGPVLCGLFILPLQAVGQLSAVAIVAASFACISMAIQLVMIPRLLKVFPR